MRAMPSLPLRTMGTVRTRRRRRSHRWLAVRKHNQRSTSGIPPRSKRTSQPRQHADELADEQVVLLADIASTGFQRSGIGERSNRRHVVVFRARPDRTLLNGGRKLNRRVLHHRGRERSSPKSECKADGRRHRARSEAVRRCRGSEATNEWRCRCRQSRRSVLQETFENCLRLLDRGTLSSLGVYSGKLQCRPDAFAAGLGDYKIVTTLCPGGKERMRRLMSTCRSKRFDPTPLLTHSFIWTKSSTRTTLRFATRSRAQSSHQTVTAT